MNKINNKCHYQNTTKNKNNFKNLSLRMRPISSISSKNNYKTIRYFVGEIVNISWYNSYRYNIKHRIKLKSVINFTKLQNGKIYKKYYYLINKKEIIL